MTRNKAVDYIAYIISENMDPKYMDVNYKDVAKMILDDLEEFGIIPLRDPVLLRNTWKKEEG